MIMMLLLLSAAGADPSAALMNNAKLQVSACAVSSADCAPSSAARYRIAGSAEDGVTSKDRAFNADPRPCNLIGAVLCTSKGRPLLSAPIDND